MKYSYTQRKNFALLNTGEQINMLKGRKLYMMDAQGLDIVNPAEPAPGIVFKTANYGTSIPAVPHIKIRGANVDLVHDDRGFAKVDVESIYVQGTTTRGIRSLISGNNAYNATGDVDAADALSQFGLVDRDGKFNSIRDSFHEALGEEYYTGTWLIVPVLTICNYNYAGDTSERGHMCQIFWWSADQTHTYEYNGLIYLVKGSTNTIGNDISNALMEVVVPYESEAFSYQAAPMADLASIKDAVAQIATSYVLSDEFNETLETVVDDAVTKKINSGIDNMYCSC